MSQSHVETITTPHKRVSCDGGAGALGHPRVWLEMGDETRITCPYCGRLYVLAGSTGTPANPGESTTGKAGADASPDA